jgi:hypothetical protein
VTHPPPQLQTKEAQAPAGWRGPFAYLETFVNSPSTLAMILCWLLAVLTLTAACVVICQLGKAVIASTDREELAACLRSLAELVRALRGPAR